MMAFRERGAVRGSTIDDDACQAWAPSFGNCGMTSHGMRPFPNVVSAQCAVARQ